jgi:ribonuclease P protein component
MTLFTKQRESGSARLGIAATRKMGGAVERNRAKRIVREVFRHHKPSGAIDIVVIPRREMLDASYERVEAEFISLLSRTPSRDRSTASNGRSVRVGPQ